MLDMFGSDQAMLRDNRMTTMSDYLVWYKTEAIEQQAVFNRYQNINIIKDV